MKSQRLLATLLVICLFLCLRMEAADEKGAGGGLADRSTAAASATLQETLAGIRCANRKEQARFVNR